MRIVRVVKENVKDFIGLPDFYLDRIMRFMLLQTQATQNTTRKQQRMQRC